ncbi:hypothetical protein BDC45DRAFT_495754 [Circinella umbellata]|nr:hypothetical protein BDC45DRAFT_495754 [Circinella umbellata]
MLGSTSVKVKPPPSSQSFAKMAAKPPPSDDKPSPRTIALEKQNQALKNQSDSTIDPSAVTHENFPTLAQANQMFEQGVSVDDKKEKAMFTEISKISDAAEAAVAVDAAKEGLDVSKEDKGRGDTTSSSFANITSNNLDKAPPSASSRPVPSHPEYDEQTMMNESMKREVRKSKQADTHEDIVTPEQVLLQERADEINTQKRNEAMIVSKCIERFDKSRQGKFTMLDTFKILCGMGYSFITAIPMTVLMHLRLSPLTSPYPLPFLYRSITDWFTLPIYTNKIVPALAYGSRSLLTGKRGAFLVNRYGRQQHGTNNIGLTFWDGIRGMNKEERLGWWQISSWAVHRLQWMVIYTILQDPKSHLVTADALSGLPSYSTSL